MTFDTERQREIILELINTATVPGVAIDEVFNFKQAVLAGRVEDKED